MTDPHRDPGPRGRVDDVDPLAEEFAPPLVDLNDFDDLDGEVGQFPVVDGHTVEEPAFEGNALEPTAFEDNVFDDPERFYDPVGEPGNESDYETGDDLGDEEEGPATRADMRGLHRPPGAGRRGAGRRIRGVLVLVVTLALVAGAGYAAFTYLKPLLSFSSESDDFPGPGTGEVAVTVNDGDTVSAIAVTLEKAGVVKTARSFSQAASADPKGNTIQPGGYTLRSQMTAAGALALLLDPANRSVPRVTIREGLWKSETFAALSKASGLPVADYVAAAKDTVALGLPAEAKGNLEGYLFPATYEFAKGSTAADQLTQMVARTMQELTQLGVPDASMERTVILASILEAEGRLAADRPKIARVIDNRLAARMRLQLDSTVSYGVQKRAVTTTDAERANPNLWNTYAHDGLPVGPIGNPGEASLKAALNPAAGPWLYFVAVNPTTGETKFSTTQAEHDRNVAEFQKWCSDHPGTC